MAPRIRPAAAGENSPWTSAESREQDRAAKREAVLRTAARFFNQKGFHATSLDDVAAALNVTKPTIYHYFANKDEILFTCTQRGLDALADSLRQSRLQPGTGADRLRVMMIAHAMEMMDDFGMCIARTQDNQLAPESRLKFRALKREIDQLIRRTLAEGVADGSVRVADIRIASFTIGLALNSIGTWFRPDGPLDREQTARLTVDTLLGGVLAQKD